MILEEFFKEMESGNIDILKHVGLPEAKSIWNEIALPLYLVGSYSDFERLFKEMLSVIEAVEKKKGGRIHKGLALYHLGLAQVSQRNFDEGIPNILDAYEEDKVTYGSEDAKRYFAYNFNKDFLSRISRKIEAIYFSQMKSKLVSNTGLASKSLENLVSTFDEGESLFFAKTMNSKMVNKFRNDFYTRVLLWDNLRNLCLLLEIYLKRKLSSNNMLGSLVPSAFNSDVWMRIYISHRGSRDANDYTYYSSPLDFSRKINQLLTDNFFSSNDEDDFLARVFLLSVLVRNFTAHNFDEYEKLLTTENLYEDVFKHAVYALLYALHRMH